MSSRSSIGAYGAVSVGATPVEIINGTTLRRSVLIQNLHASQDLYIGTDNAVAVATGLKLSTGQSLELYDFIGPVWGIASGAATDVRYLEIGG